MSAASPRPNRHDSRRTVTIQVPERRRQRSGPSQSWSSSETTSTPHCSTRFATHAKRIARGRRSERCWASPSKLLSESTPPSSRPNTSPYRRVRPTIRSRAWAMRTLGNRRTIGGRGVPRALHNHQTRPERSEHMGIVNRTFASTDHSISGVIMWCRPVPATQGSTPEPDYRRARSRPRL